MVQDTHTPPETEKKTYSVWISPEREDKPTKYTGVADAMKMPNGVIKIAHHNGVVDKREGEITRLRQEGLDG